MSTVAFIRRCLAVGMDMDTALVAAEAFEEQAPALVPSLTARQARNRRHYENKRLKASETSEVEAPKTGSVAPKTVKTPSDAAPPRTRVVLASLPSLRSEELSNPLTLPSGASPDKPKSKRSRLVPETWAPSDQLIASLTTAGHSPGEIERELANFRDHEFRDPKSDFDRTFRRWMRQSRNFQPRSPNDARPSPDAKLAAKQANYARAWEGSERAFGRDGKP